jgi:sporulation protein YlmC with PRC-barrel domain
MLRSLRELERYKVSATDGDIGHVVNFLLDDQHWIVRYLVVETSGFLDGRRVLITPISFRQVEWATNRFHLALTKGKVQNSPSIDTDKPVSRQHELDYHGYYGYPYYWGSSGFWGTGADPGLLAAGNWNDVAVEHTHKANDIHLRSANELRGYHIQGSDEAIGHVDDFVVDDKNWAIRYLVIDTSNWWMGKQVLIAPHWANRVSWEEKCIYVAMNRQSIKNSPEWGSTASINREYEERLYEHYRRPVYWDDDARRVRVPPTQQHHG